MPALLIICQPDPALGKVYKPIQRKYKAGRPRAIIRVLSLSMNAQHHGFAKQLRNLLTTG
jgi:hypothetical protein